MNQKHLLLAAALLLSATPALAIDKIYSPNTVKGELEIEYSGSATFDNHDAKNNLQEHELEFEYGLTDKFVLELNGTFEKEPGESTELKDVGIGGRYQFFEQGEHWVDSGLLLSYGRATHHDDVDAIEAKLLLEKQVGKFLHRTNIGFEQEVGGNAHGGPEGVFAWSSRYRYNEHFEPGFEIQSDFGKLNETHQFDQQEHYIGPAFYGKIAPGWNYEAAYYFGVSDPASQGAARVLVEYERYF